MEMDSWKRYIDNNFESDKKKLLDKMVESEMVTMNEYKELLIYIGEVTNEKK